MPEPADTHIGAQIADYRKLRQLTQTALAQRSYLSRSTIAKVEKGLSPATPTVVAAVARVLQVPVAVLNGQPYMSELKQDHLDKLIAPLAEALDLYDLPDPDVTPRPYAEVEQEVRSLCADTCATEYKTVGGQLPGLLGELTTAISLLTPGADLRRTANSLSWCYWTAYEFAYRLGYHELATIALERMKWTAEQAQDPLLLAIRLNKRSSMLLRRGDNQMSLKILASGHRLVEEHEESGSVEALAVSGSLHLAAAIAAAQAKDSDAVTGHMELAHGAAKKIGRDVPDVYWAAFGRTNVSHFDVATQVELGELGEAVQRAKKVHFPDSYPKMRVGRYHIEMARAYAEMGKPGPAEVSLLRARRAAPQQARYHPLMRETIGTLVRRQRRAPESLTALAAWIGM